MKGVCIAPIKVWVLTSVEVQELLAIIWQCSSGDLIIISTLGTEFILFLHSLKVNLLRDVDGPVWDKWVWRILVDVFLLQKMGIWGLTCNVSDYSSTDSSKTKLHMTPLPRRDAVTCFFPNHTLRCKLYSLQWLWVHVDPTTMLTCIWLLNQGKPRPSWHEH